MSIFKPDPILFLLFLNPIAEIHLDKTFSSINFYNNQIYLAQFTGTGIYQFDTLKKLTAFTFTDIANYRIYDFFVTPFAIYTNNGKEIEKFYLSSGEREVVYRAKDLSSFTINSCEEVVLADQGEHKLLFLDRDNQVRLEKIHLFIRDLQCRGDTIYALSNNYVILFDEYGNVLKRESIPEALSKFYVEDKSIFLFSPDKEYFYIHQNEWKKFEYPLRISDICSSEKYIIILDGHGTNLFFYNNSEFKLR